jgi:prophage regulatory protein
VSNQVTQENRLIRLPEVMRRVGMARPTVYRAIKEGRFPEPVKVGSASMWVEREIEAWIRERIAESRGGIAA